MGSDFFNGGNADGGKIDIKAKTIKVDTGKGNTIKVTMSYGAYCEAKRPDLRSKTVAFRF